MNKLSIAHVTSEVDPYAKTGGLGNVTRSLPKALKRMGHEIVVIMPFYEKIIDSEKHKIKLFKESLEIRIDKNNTEKVNIYIGWLMEGLPIYFIGNKKYFGRKKTIYGSKHENARFYLFNLAAIKLLKILDWQPNIIHCHDWHTGLIPELLKKRYNKEPFFDNTATLYTIHNLMFQLGHPWWEIPSSKRDNGRTSLPNFNNRKIEYINFAKRAILNADIINAVSESYALEIMTKPYGEDLHRILKNRKERLFGIVNGIDYEDYNPSQDPGLYKKYSAKNSDKKYTNKEWLQKFLKLEVSNKKPLITMVARIAEQKGFDLLKKIIEPLLIENVQFAIMGDGDKSLISFFKKIEKNYPHKFRLVPFQSKYETSFYAGADMLLLPSRFEPCGLNQLIGMRYGCVPIVRQIGGLADTVEDYNPKNDSGHGFVFKHYYSKELLIAITRALESYKYDRHWSKLVTRIMQLSNSWVIPAQKYTVLYEKAIAEKNG